MTSGLRHINCIVHCLPVIAVKSVVVLSQLYGVANLVDMNPFPHFICHSIIWDKIRYPVSLGMVMLADELRTRKKMPV